MHILTIILLDFKHKYVFWHEYGILWTRAILGGGPRFQWLRFYRTVPACSRDLNYHFTVLPHWNVTPHARYMAFHPIMLWTRNLPDATTIPFQVPGLSPLYINKSLITTHGTDILTIVLSRWLWEVYSWKGKTIYTCKAENVRNIWRPGLLPWQTYIKLESQKALHSIIRHVLTIKTIMFTRQAGCLCWRHPSLCDIVVPDKRKDAIRRDAFSSIWRRKTRRAGFRTRVNQSDHSHRTHRVIIFLQWRRRSFDVGASIWIDLKGLFWLDMLTSNRRRRYCIKIITQRVRCEWSNRLTRVPKLARHTFCCQIAIDANASRLNRLLRHMFQERATRTFKCPLGYHTLQAELVNLTWWRWLLYRVSGTRYLSAGMVRCAFVTCDIGARTHLHVNGMCFPDVHKSTVHLTPVKQCLYLINDNCFLDNKSLLTWFEACS